VFAKENGMCKAYSRFLLLSLSLAFVSNAAYSQRAGEAYPAKPVVFIAPFAAGGPVDIESRIYAKKMGEVTGQRIIVDYKPGGGSSIGALYVAKSQADGYTLLIGTGGFTILPNQYKNLPYDTIKDFAPISQMSQRTTVLLTRPSFPAKTFTAYVAYARSNPAQINYGVFGASLVVGAWLHNISGTKVTFVKYRGVGPATVDLMAERLDVMPSTLAAALPLIKSGKVNALAIMGARRSQLLPNVATVAEQGTADIDYKEWAEFSGNWFGFLAPSATPAVTINKLAEIFGAIAKSPDIVAELEGQGSAAIGSTPAQFRKLVATEVVRWQKVMQETGITLEVE